MPEGLSYVLAVAGAYLLGTIPMGIFIVRAYTGKDIRHTGSGRTGGTNALRAAGFVAGLLTSLSDIAKGYGAVSLARLLVPGLPWLEVACGLAAIAGHNWSIWLGFKGGVGASTSIGVLTAFWPWAAPLYVLASSATLYIVGYASVTSTVVAVTAPILLAYLARNWGYPLVYVLYGFVAMLLMTLALVPNYRRLLQGTERAVGPRAKALAARRDDGVAPSGA